MACTATVCATFACVEACIPLDGLSVSVDTPPIVTAGIEAPASCDAPGASVQGDTAQDEFEGL